MDRCTEAVGLPFAARRLYTADGKEVSSLSDLQRNDLVYVTCGEPWSDPQLSYSEQQRRAVLANLAADISHIRKFCALRDPSGNANISVIGSLVTREIKGLSVVKSEPNVNHSSQSQRSQAVH